MRRNTIRPEIIVKNHYIGNESMKDIFIKMFVLQMQKDVNSICTFENIKNTEYNFDKNRLKEES